MTVNNSVAVRNAKLDAEETAWGASPLLKFYTGAKPADCATASSGTMLGSMTLPADPMANASGGTKSMQGTWQVASAAAAGTAGYFRVFDSTGTTCHKQGSVTATGGGGDMTIDNAVIAIGQTVNVTSFTITAGNP